MLKNTIKVTSIILLLLPATACVYSQSSLRDSVKYHFRMLDSLAQKNKTDTIYTINYARSIEFMIQHTKIDASSGGTYYGRLGYTRENLRKWHNGFRKKGFRTEIYTPLASAVCHYRHDRNGNLSLDSNNCIALYLKPFN